ncbi:DUF4395 domain-containing protein [Microbacterium sp. KUDC0406]|uniref:DUF4395 domain-containing protein n=1 Tax=Microbacterium sp. KUDC0406 TaxID=2909588 RepID=UPI001F3FC34E|nr:DUF4395 domain-containing protein [Microbacterium sp. KUDC0406]UJP11304.1 DUF4395 domain-containing protein [Microbacterium sp. KUDC0406]
MSTPTGIDPRGPRFAAFITAVLLLVAVLLGLTGLSTQQSAASFGWFAYQPLVTDPDWTIAVVPVSERFLDAAFLLLLAIALLFLWGVLSPRTQPWSVLYRTTVRPLLSPPTELEDPRPPRFAQGVGLFVVGLGLLLHLLGVPWALPIAAAAAFVAAFLNAVFGFCLGCELYLLLRRAGILRTA